ncbi:MAG: hypothetical protein KIT54_10845 [Phycisphaeraceae bacterium]|nr:hypothetical protein [Phycisphaeraceae bacterium]
MGTGTTGPTVNAVLSWDPDGPGPQQAITVVAGQFTLAGSMPVSNIAAWDGQQWLAFGDGLNGGITSLADYNGELIAAGSFTSSGGTAINRIARWDGTAWQPLAAGFDNQVYALTVFDGDLVAAGRRSGSTNSRISRWDGLAWTDIVPTLGNDALALTVFDGKLIAGGSFTAPSRIAQWDGTAWLPIGSGMNNTVQALCVHEGSLVAGGNFTTAGGLSASRIASWDGTQWQALSTGTGNTVRALSSREGILYAGGDFTSIGGTSATRVAAWNGTAWSPLRMGLDGQVNSLAFDSQDDLVAGGSFLSERSFPMLGVARWDGTRWNALASSFNQWLAKFVEWDGKLIAGGQFDSAGGTAARGIASWDGISWSPMGDQDMRGTSNLVVYDGQLLASGLFDDPSFTTEDRIAIWDGSRWRPFGGGVNGSIVTMHVYRGELYAGGGFTEIGGVAANAVARWDGTAWHALGSGITGMRMTTSLVQSMEVYNDELYVAGSFTTAGGLAAPNIARWDGTTWRQAGGGIPGWTSFQVVNDLEVFQGELYATGNALREGVEILRWDGSTWRALPTGLTGADFTGSVGGRGMAVYKDKLYVGGIFTAAGGLDTRKIARWTGDAWERVGAAGLGLTLTTPLDMVRTLHVYGGELIMGGRFSAVGTQASGNFARWTETGIPWVARQPQAVSVRVGEDVALSAVPATGYANIAFQWQRDGQDIGNGPGGASPSGGEVSGAAGMFESPTAGGTAQLLVRDAQIGDSGLYAMVLTGPCGQSQTVPVRVIVCCRADLDCDGSTDVFDFLAFQNLFAAGDLAADFDGDGVLTIFDFLAFQNLFDAGCG